MDNFIPSYTDQGFAPLDNLIAQDAEIETRSVTQLSGQANLVRGTLLGKRTTNTFALSAKAGNTGNATITAGPTGTSLTKPGLYSLVFTGATAYNLLSPDGEVLFTAAALGAYAGAAIGYTVTAGGTPMVAGDTLYITVSGDFKYKLCVATATDGSQNPVAILAQDTDATAGDTVTLVYEKGVFNENAVTFDASIYTAGAFVTATVRDVLRSIGIFFKSPVTAS